MVAGCVNVNFAWEHGRIIVGVKWEILICKNAMPNQNAKMQCRKRTRFCEDFELSQLLGPWQKKAPYSSLRVPVPNTVGALESNTVSVALLIF